MPELKNDRASLLNKMREEFREQAEKNLALYREFYGGTPDDAAQKGMNILWLQSVTDGNELSKTYYVSPLWQTICKDVLLRDGFMCMACHRDAEVVHHRSYGYVAMAGLDDSKLISLCKPCHHYIHFHHARKTVKSEWEGRLRWLQKFFAQKRRKREVRFLAGRLGKTIRRFVKPDAHAANRHGFE
jgi:hypothetical protein